MTKKLKKVTIVIPALNEEKGIGPVLKEIPIEKLKKIGYATEILVVDNGSTDRTPHIARKHGALVVIQPMRGYGNAYKAGFAFASGDIIATGDADLTYPFSILPSVIKKMEKENLDFVNTDRLTKLNPAAMTWSHVYGNYFLSFICKLLFRVPFKDSQSGMWIFKRDIWKKLRVRSTGMPFSQELKIEAFVRGFKCAEVAIIYRARAGKVKLNTVTDGFGNIVHLLKLKKKIASRNNTKSKSKLNLSISQ